MNKLKDTITTVIGTIIICGLFAIMVPELRTPLLCLGDVIKEIFAKFYLEDTIKEILLYIAIETAITALGFGISEKTEKQIWKVVAIILDVATFVIVLCL